jgi:hypothetical protein
MHTVGTQGSCRLLSYTRTSYPVGLTNGLLALTGYQECQLISLLWSRVVTLVLISVGLHSTSLHFCECWSVLYSPTLMPICIHVSHLLHLWFSTSNPAGITIYSCISRTQMPIWNYYNPLNPEKGETKKIGWDIPNWQRGIFVSCMKIIYGLGNSY